VKGRDFNALTTNNAKHQPQRKFAFSMYKKFLASGDPLGNVVKQSYAELEKRLNFSIIAPEKVQKSFSTRSAEYDIGLIIFFFKPF